jgi:hypothetical protein
VNYQAPSRPTVTNSIDGLVVLPISSEKWRRRLLQARQAFLNVEKKMKLQYRYILNEPLSVDTAGRIRVEEASPSVQLLLCTKGRRPHPDLPVLLRCDPAVGHGP